ncbi:MAG: aminotransferase class I/II-fold pyridoxal phosphate-dependent enzyme [Halobacteriovoraceae bacterium]|jgi:aspartate aminotransferase|nr:aminotransferase class I/II-fold pyridoxal phosphate-dependent enzyme [Halobacteriovoraceae bacterium]
MKLSSRVSDMKTSITLKVNEKINKMLQNGIHVYNMTSGQLPFKPCGEFVSTLSKQLNFLKSYQYSPIAGMPKLRRKFIDFIEEKRGIDFGSVETPMECIISNGSKHSLYNVFGALLDPGDEVILLAPYWVSYPEIIKFWRGVPVIVKSHAFDAYTPALEDIEKAITDKTKAIIINSPNNPAGIHYTDSWMKNFAKFLNSHPELTIISDEIYSELSYFDPKPSYFYQFDKELLSRTVIIHGISKSFAATGLRIGFCIADAELTKAMAKVQSQTTSGPNSLVQRALVDFDFHLQDNYFDTVKEELRECAQIIRISFRDANLAHCYYQTNSAFYYLLDFSRMPFFKKFQLAHADLEESDLSKVIVDDILDKAGVALAPGSAFGYPNSARMSMTLDTAPFKEAIGKLTEYLTSK